jgi:hypothetical protein
MHNARNRRHATQHSSHTQQASNPSVQHPTHVGAQPSQIPLPNGTYSTANTSNASIASSNSTNTTGTTVAAEQPPRSSRPHMPSLAAVRRTLFTSNSSSAASSRAGSTHNVHQLNGNTHSGSNSGVPSASHSRHASPRHSPERTIPTMSRPGMTTPKANGNAVNGNGSAVGLPPPIRMGTPSSLAGTTMHDTPPVSRGRDGTVAGKGANGNDAEMSELQRLLRPRALNEDLIERDSRGAPLLDSAIPLSRGSRHSHPHHPHSQLSALFPGEEERLRGPDDSGKNLVLHQKRALTLDMQIWKSHSSPSCTKNTNNGMMLSLWSFEQHCRSRCKTS